MSLLLLQIIANNYTWFFALIILINITIYVCIFQGTASFLDLLGDGDQQLPPPPQKPKSRPRHKGKGKGKGPPTSPTYSGSLRSQRSPATSTVTSEEQHFPISVEEQHFPISVTPLSSTTALVDTTPQGHYSSNRPDLAFMNTMLLDLDLPPDTPTVSIARNLPLDTHTVDSIDLPMQTPICSPKSPSAGDDTTQENFSDST